MGNDREHSNGRKAGAPPAEGGPGIWGHHRALLESRGALRESPGVGAILDRVIEAGAALIVARTRDGGAIALTLLNDDGREKTYAVSQADLDDALSELANRYK